ncbi:type II secretion system F family protein [Pseudonocardia sp. H11422]|uniref:type II secretion system F family protein n=1 Tax=Pseudonocardia sp. H11422 TaxID=2835866 RepID=UPI001BDDC384|nr:type II secretion system F family protein [Pseudonocardia sp. H11422]
MSAVPVALLAAAMLCAPGSGAPGRLGALAGVPRLRRGSLRSPAGAWLIALGAGLGLLVAGVGGAVAGGLTVRVWEHRRARRRAEQAGADAGTELADALARITDELRAGAHPAAALAGIDGDGPLARAALGPAAVAARLGDGVPAALARSAGHPAVAADVTRIAAAWALAERHGAPLADLLEGMHSDIRWRVAHSKQVRAQLAGPRATATVLIALPVLGLGLGQLIGADPLGVLRSGFLGQVLLVIGVGLVAAGVLWTEHILRSAVPR